MSRRSNRRRREALLEAKALADLPDEERHEPPPPPDRLQASYVVARKLAAQEIDERDVLKCRLLVAAGAPRAKLRRTVIVSRPGRRPRVLFDVPTTRETLERLRHEGWSIQTLAAIAGLS